jgi:alkanesulfonate monooxygenase SsuD/methylene tetrahydromethanopterin reductase-like flavin-dependent oxidoreductase (luciferase family)
VWFSDHFMDDGAYVREAWVMLGYAAALAPELQLGHLVLCNSYRAKWSQSTETLVGYHARESPDAR